MTVEELIKRLQELDPTLPVFVWDPVHAKNGSCITVSSTIINTYVNLILFTK